MKNAVGEGVTSFYIVKKNHHHNKPPPQLFLLGEKKKEIKKKALNIFRALLPIFTKLYEEPASAN